MQPIKLSDNVEFDVIYADGTRRHVTEGVLFEAKENRLIFHSGTDREAVIIGVAEGAAEAVGLLGLSEAERALIIYNIHKRIMGRKDAAPDMEVK